MYRDRAAVQQDPGVRWRGVSTANISTATRVGGTTKALDEADLKEARALLRSGEYGKVQVADELEASRHTLWRALSLEKTK
ncbi:MAG TPA: helix-turn-helix domain-containing protein [Bryobacteraceae bacterium]|nr:helix-turn-helix domain-containing protein [Bryobacteraceae bacterium]